MLAAAKSGVQIRLTNERWAHMTEEHTELAGMRLDVLYAVEQPERVLEGAGGELLAVKEIETGKWLVSVSRETADDGFFITAFLTRRARSFAKRKQRWP